MRVRLFVGLCLLPLPLQRVAPTGAAVRSAGPNNARTAAAGAAHAQTSAEAEVLAVVRRLFDGMRAGDSAIVRTVFDVNARLVSAAIRDGQPYARVTTAEEFIAAVGRPHDAVWDERIWDTEVRVDGNLASVWTKYAFYLGDRFSHCGVDAFHLVRRAEGWKIVDLADMRRQEGCETPPSRP